MRLKATFLVLCLIASATAAQEDAASRRSVIQSMLPVMVQRLKEGRFEEARQICQKAIAWEPAEPAHRYNLACVEAVAGQRDAAFAALDEAVARGFKDTEVLGTDPDLASLRADPRFADVVRRVAQNAIARVDPAAGAPVVVPAAPDGPAPAVDQAEPAAHRFVGGLPVGLYARTSSGLPDQLFYFAPGGAVYDNPPGFSAQSLARSKRRGTASLAGDQLVVTWENGERVSSKPLGKGQFFWNEGMWLPARRFPGPAALVGTWTSSSSSAFSNFVKAGTLELKADGSFTGLDVSSATSDSSGGSRIRAVGVGNAAGRWSVDGHTLTLSGPGAAQQLLAVVVELTAGKIDWAWLGDRGYKVTR